MSDASQVRINELAANSSQGKAIIDLLAGFWRNGKETHSSSITAKLGQVRHHLKGVPTPKRQPDARARREENRQAKAALRRPCCMQRPRSGEPAAQFLVRRQAHAPGTAPAAIRGGPPRRKNSSDASVAPAPAAPVARPAGTGSTTGRRSCGSESSGPAAVPAPSSLQGLRRAPARPASCAYNRSSGVRSQWSATGRDVQHKPGTPSNAARPAPQLLVHQARTTSFLPPDATGNRGQSRTVRAAASARAGRDPDKPCVRKTVRTGGHHIPRARRVRWPGGTASIWAETWPRTDGIAPAHARRRARDLPQFQRGLPGESGPGKTALVARRPTQPQRPMADKRKMRGERKLHSDRQRTGAAPGGCSDECARRTFVPA